MSFSHKNMKDIADILKWILIGILLGVLGGLLGTVFSKSLNFVTELRIKHSYLLLGLPLGGLLIVAMYNYFRSEGNIDTKRIFQAVKENKDIPVVMIPLIFIGTLITHMLGGSAGREGAALQLGGSMGYNTAKVLKQNKNNTKLMITAGMSSVFAALFGTPFAAAVFSLEVTREKEFNYRALLLGIVSSVSAFVISSLLGVAPVRFVIPALVSYRVNVILKVILLAVLCAGVCTVFATAIHKTEHLMEKYLSSYYIRAVIGGLLIVLLTIILKTTDYNGAGIDVIKSAISGEAKPEAFLLKIIFTAITVAAGFKGGEIVPTFFIGATFGCFISGLTGLGEGLGAALGLAALFAGMTKCPVAAFLLAIEVFGTKGMPLFAIAITITYIFSGHFGLYEDTNEHPKFWFYKEKEIV